MRELIDFGREFVLSFNPSAAEAAEVVRGHWMIESIQVKLPLRLEELFSYEVHMTSSPIQHHSPHSKN